MKDSNGFEWGWCDLCDCAFLYCPKCGNNCCNGGSGTVNGERCDFCIKVYGAQDKAREDRIEPTKEQLKVE